MFKGILKQAPDNNLDDLSNSKIIFLKYVFNSKNSIYLSN